MRRAGNGLMSPAMSRTGNATSRKRQRSDTAIGMANDVRATGLVLDERLDQPQLVVQAKLILIWPSVCASIADEIGRDQAKARLERIDHGRPHRRGAGGAVQQ